MLNDMFDFSNPETISKAIAGGLGGVLIGELARYGFRPGPAYINAIGVILTGLVSYVAGHVVVYLAKRNQPKL
jgi:hypothetical protein